MSVNAILVHDKLIWQFKNANYLQLKSARGVDKDLLGLLGDALKAIMP